MGKTGHLPKQEIFWKTALKGTRRDCRCMQDGHPPVKPMPKYKTFDFWLIQIYVNPNIPAHKWGGGGGPPLGGVNGIEAKFAILAPHNCWTATC